ncbi:hypothetical protein BC828DRAFT_387402 [Blastocladiella britannica]|nr:hypothetical protein BC828DRAFT_387402 [Blastocladiella britannica]
MSFSGGLTASPSTGNFPMGMSTIGRSRSGSNANEASSTLSRSPSRSGTTGPDEEDELLKHPIILNLRDKIYANSHEFLKQQRFSCMLAGAWFQAPPPSTAGGLSTSISGSFSAASTSTGPAATFSSRKTASRPMVWRFCKMSGTKKTLHWADFPEQLERKPSMDQLTERLDLAMVADLLTGLNSPIHGAVVAAAAHASITISPVPHSPGTGQSTVTFASTPPRSPSPANASGQGSGGIPRAPPPPPPGSEGESSQQFQRLGGVPPAPPPIPTPAAQAIAAAGGGTIRKRTASEKSTVGTLHGQAGISPAPVPPPPLHSVSFTSGPGAADMSTLCFSLMSTGDPPVSLLDLICPTATQFSEWTDGLNVIFGRPIANKDTQEFVQSLTDVEVRLRLLDVVADNLTLRMERGEAAAAGADDTATDRAAAAGEPDVINKDGPWLSQQPSSHPTKCDLFDMPEFPPDLEFFYDDIAGAGGDAGAGGPGSLNSEGDKRSEGEGQTAGI